MEPAAAVDFLEGVGYDAIRSHEAGLLAYALEEMARIPELTVFGPADLRERSGVISFPWGMPTHTISPRFWTRREWPSERGIIAPSMVMGHFRVPATTRASFALYNTTDDVDRLVEGLQVVHSIFGR